VGGFAVTLVKVKEKYQVTLPASVRRKAGLAVGDLLEAKVQGGKITLTPKSIVDREIALALEDVKKGRVYGPFSTAKETIRSLHREANKLRKK
jgi:AbrB family looped-hinge helix DNA binding protein